MFLKYIKTHIINLKTKTSLFFCIAAIIFINTPESKGENLSSSPYSFYNKKYRLAASLNNTEDTTPPIPFKQDIAVINTHGTEKIKLEYTGSLQYFKVILFYSSINKTLQDINILHNGERIDQWNTPSDMENKLPAGKIAIESYVALSPGSIITLTGSNSKSGQTGADYIKLVKTSASSVPNQKPAADFIIHIQETTVSFDAQNSSDADGEIIAYQWEFGDGNTGSGITTTHHYAQEEGIYQVKLKVTDERGASSEYMQEISLKPSAKDDTTEEDINEDNTTEGNTTEEDINDEDINDEDINEDNTTENILPVAILDFAPPSATAPVEITFLASDSRDTDGYITSYTWQFGDGNSASGKEVRHIYSLPGTYTVSLTVFDNENQHHTATREFTVEKARTGAPAAQFTINEYQSIIEHSLLFDASISRDKKGYNIISYHWNMGDSTRLQGETVYYSYKKAGIYHPTLTITNELGEISHFSATINIREYNMAPQASAGDDKILYLPQSSITLTGTGSDEDGRIISYRWTFLSGPKNIEIEDPESSMLPLANLTEGTYVFRFTVVDNNGASAFNDIRLKVQNQEPKENKLPVADAGQDIKTSAPTVKIKGNAYDPDGQIASYHWEQIHGTKASIQDKEALTLEVTNLTEGEHLFRITVVDNEGAKAHDDVKVTYFRKANIIAAKKAFTPNGDGIDDTWHIENADELGEFEILIMDRSGNKIYQADTYHNEWDATYRGAPLPNADYYYIIKCRDGSTAAGGIRVIR